MNSSHKVHHILTPFLTEQKLSRQILIKDINLKLHKSPCGGSRHVPCWRTDRRDDALNRFSHLCET